MSATWHGDPPSRKRGITDRDFRRLLAGPSLEQVQPYIDMPHSALAERCWEAERERDAALDSADRLGVEATRARVRETELETELEKEPRRATRPWAPWWCWAMSGAGVTLAYAEAGWTWALGAIAVLALSWWTISWSVKEGEL